MLIAIFEDERYTELLPITYSRPIFLCRVGLKTPLERCEEAFKGSEKILFVRDYLKDRVMRRCGYPVNDLGAIDEDVLLVRGSVIAEHGLKSFIDEELPVRSLATRDGEVILAHLPEKEAREALEELLRSNSLSELLKKRDHRLVEASGIALIKYPWDLISMNSSLISMDFTDLGLGGTLNGDLDGRAVIYGDMKNLYVGEKAVVEGSVKLDARAGPIYVDDEAEIQSGSVVCGPAYIGRGSKIYSALLREGSNIGEECRVGGEISQTILHRYVNKYHYGYLGHSYICPWVNVGAGTVNSDLKNTYGTVKMKVRGARVDTGLRKVGCFIGDHSKLSIGTSIYCGVKVGFASQTHGLVMEDVPSFTLWAKSLGIEPVELDLESAIKTERIVFGRRNVKQREEDVELIKRIFIITEEERREAKVKKGKFKMF